jgi:hypothetical protein
MYEIIVCGCYACGESRVREQIRVTLKTPLFQSSNKESSNDLKCLTMLSKVLPTYKTKSSEISFQKKTVTDVTN